MRVSESGRLPRKSYLTVIIAWKTSDTKNISGFGLGLYLSAEIIQSHLGRIWVESVISQGSAFSFDLPKA